MAVRMPMVADVLDALALRLSEAAAAVYDPNGMYPADPPLPPVFVTT